MTKKQLLTIISTIIITLLIMLIFPHIASVLSGQKEPLQNGYNILIDADGKILSAGFTDFSGEAIDGKEQIINVGSEIPENITTYYYYDKTNNELKLRSEPLPTLMEKIEEEKKENALREKLFKEDIKQRYMNANGVDEKIDIIAEYLELL